MLSIACCISATVIHSVLLLCDGHRRSDADRALVFSTLRVSCVTVETPVRAFIVGDSVTVCFFVVVVVGNCVSQINVLST